MDQWIIFGIVVWVFFFIMCGISAIPMLASGRGDGYKMGARVILLGLFLPLVAVVAVVLTPYWVYWLFSHAFPIKGE